MSLPDYVRNGWLRRHEPTRDEIATLLALADRDLQQCRVTGLAPEWSFDIAYNAVLQCATAALAATGHQAERENKHLRTLECLEFTVGLSSAEVAFFDLCRRMRHRSVYEQLGAISPAEAEELRARAADLRRRVEVRLRESRPDLLP